MDGKVEIVCYKEVYPVPVGLQGDGGGAGGVPSREEDHRDRLDLHHITHCTEASALS